jgi:protein-L-isoaspartate(D-aspartate) O-methyltransferase
VGNTRPGARLARLLAARGTFIDPQWHRAVLAVGRQAFLPEVIYGSDPAHPGWECPITPDDPRWERWTSGDYALVTQVDDGAPAGEQGRGRTPTSSISQPSLVVEMLHQLNASDGHRVLEIGTGTGYNTALLCHALGEKAVVSVEIDRGLAATAIDNLARAGYKPTVLDGDGEGHPESGVGEGDFHRVLATVAARGAIPHTWVRQTWPGGVIVTPWEVGTLPGVLVRLVVGENDVAHGRIVGDAPFMVLRQQRADRRRVRDLMDDNDPTKQAGHTTVNPRVVAYRNPGWQLVLGHLVPDLRYASCEAAEDRPEWTGEATVYVATPDGSWALAEYTPAGAPYETEYAGARDLWGEVGVAWDAWCAAGRPGRDRLGVTVDARGTRLWVDSPDTDLSPLGGAILPG